MKTNAEWQKADPQLPGDRDGAEGRVIKGHKEILGHDGYIYYLNCQDLSN